MGPGCLPYAVLAPPPECGPPVAAGRTETEAASRGNRVSPF